jgi:protease-4
MRIDRVLGAALFGATLSCTISLPTRIEPLEETVVLGKGGPKIVQLEVEGLIIETPRPGPLSITPRESLIARLKEALDRAEEDRRVAALLLRIQSPGGTVSASETLYHEILSWKARTGRPVVAHFDGIATSGAYYIAMAADEVIMHPASVTGSIGVIFSGINLSGLMEKLGIENQSLTSGAFKDAGSPMRPMRPEERAQLQSVIDDFHARFIEVVDAGRPNLDRETITRAADGRIYSSAQALDLGLVDRIGYVEEAVRAAEHLAGIAESRVVSYHRPYEYRNNLHSRSAGPEGPLVDLDPLPEASFGLEPGFYYLWPAVLTGG